MDLATGLRVCDLLRVRARMRQGHLPSRTRALPALLGASCVVLLGVLGASCDDQPPASDPDTWKDPGSPRTPGRGPSDPRNRAQGDAGRAESRREAQFLDDLRRDAGLDQPTDPAGPSGQLKAEIEGFTTLEACVRDRAIHDPLLSDAIEALGYDTFTHDACRILQALKTRSLTPCHAIAASSLRSRCEADVAILVAKPELCPRVSGMARIEMHDAACLAGASGDERLCAAVTIPAQAACRAFVRADPAACRADASCIRRIARWRGLLSTHAQPNSEAAEAHLHVSLTPTQDAGSGSSGFDLDEMARAGVAVKRVGGGRLEFTLGTPPNPSWPSWDGQGASPRLFVSATVNPSDLAKGPVPLTAPRVALELLVPGLARFSGVTARKIEIDTAQLGAEVGAPFAFTLSADLQDGPKTAHATIALESFVRDLVK